jgi:ubiquinone/menaquinone biosynthesis C-methylase UbiE
VVRFKLNSPFKGLGVMGIKEYYERYWSKEIKGSAHSEVPEWTDENMEWHLKFFQEFSGRKILDAGAGDGTFLNYLIRKLPVGTRAVALEISKAAIQKGRGNYPDIVFQENAIEGMEFERNTFDTVFAIEVVEHLLDIDQALSKINRVLKKGGFFCVTTTDFNLLKKLIISVFFWDTFFYPNSPHIRFFTKRTLVDLCKKHELSLVKHQWNKSYFGVMPKGQMTVFRKTG